jgi:phosphoglycerate dehydrogenase-like enzyme
MGDERMLVWTTSGTLAYLADLPPDVTERLEIVEVPADPFADPGLGDVRALIPPLVRNQGDDSYSLESLFARTTRLEYIQTLTAGVDSIVDAVPAGVTLCSVRGAYDELMAELLLGGILAVFKEFPHYVSAQSRGSWDPRQVRVLSGSTVLFVGYGSIARCLERYLAPFEPRVLRIARTARDGVEQMSALNTLLPQADVVVVLTPLTAETRGLVDAEFLGRMKPGALIVNGARGLVADTDALIEAAMDRGVRAFLDVTEPEPLPPAHPLWSAPGVFITPHIGSFVSDNRDRCFAVIRDNLTRWVRGERLLNVVEEGY